MNEARVQNLLSSHESIRLEFKEARNAIPAFFYQTICAFLNREGGDILFGVDDRGVPVGVESAEADRLCSAIASSTNDADFFDPPFMLSPVKSVVDGKILIIVQVPESSLVHRYKGTVYDRGADGDFKVRSPDQIARLSNRKQNYYSEAKFYPYLRISDLDERTINKARNLISARKEGHPWPSLDTEAMLRSAGLLARDFATGQEGLCLAAGLLFGKEETISSLVPLYAPGSTAEFIEGELFRTIIHLTPQVTPQVTAQVTPQATAQVGAERIENILQFCAVPRSRDEIQDLLGIQHREYFRKEILIPLLQAGLLEPTLPDKPNSPKQKYVRRSAPS